MSSFLANYQIDSMFFIMPFGILIKFNTDAYFKNRNLKTLNETLKKA